jgi:uncharacterized protein (TIGR03067 family)
VCGRLARARVLLARRLTRSGVALSAAALETLLAADTAPACVPAPVVATVLRSVSLPAAAAGAVSPRVLTLAQGVCRALFLSKLKVAAVALGIASVLGAGVAGLARHLPAADGQGSAASGAPAALTHAGPPADAPRGVQMDSRQLQGSWVLVWLIDGGQKSPTDAAREVRLELTDPTLRSDHAGRLFRQAAYTTDPTQEPRRIDITSLGDHVCRGIYRIDGDQLTLCHARPGGERPTRFESPPDSGVILTLWRRAEK